MICSIAINLLAATLWDAACFKTVGGIYERATRSSSAASRLNVECNCEMWREKCMDRNIAAFDRMCNKVAALPG